MKIGSKTALFRKINIWIGKDGGISEIINVHRKLPFVDAGRHNFSTASFKNVNEASIVYMAFPCYI